MGAGLSSRRKQTRHPFSDFNLYGTVRIGTIWHNSDADELMEGNRVSGGVAEPKPDQQHDNQLTMNQAGKSSSPPNHHAQPVKVKPPSLASTTEQDIQSEFQQQFPGLLETMERLGIGQEEHFIFDRRKQQHPNTQTSIIKRFQQVGNGAPNDWRGFKQRARTRIETTIPMDPIEIGGQKKEGTKQQQSSTDSLQQPNNNGSMVDALLSELESSHFHFIEIDPSKPSASELLVPSPLTPQKQRPQLTFATTPKRRRKRRMISPKLRFFHSSRSKRIVPV